MTEENINTPTNEDTTPDNIPENTPEVTPEAAPELPLENTPEIKPSEAKPEVAPSNPQPEIPYVNTPQAPYTQPYQAPVAPQTPPYAPPYQPYQPQAPQYTPNTPQPQKKSAGVKVMLICLFVLLGIFSFATVGSMSYFLGKMDANDKLPSIDNPVIDFFSPTEPTEATTAPQITEEDVNLFGEGEIVLNPYPENINDTAKYNNQTAFSKVSPSAVGIMCYSDSDKEKLMGQGTGIVVNTDGYIATNSHVIGDSKTAYIIEVVLDSGDTFDAKVVGFDTRTDLAVLKIEAKGLVPAEFADSDLISIGEDVIAVGNPGGMEFQNTLTRGVISAKDRTLDLSTQVKYIQTDAAINPGNSGGPLCNLAGQVIGINSAKIASEEYEGMGFAIPSRTVKEVVDDLIHQGFVSGRVKIGVMGTAVTASEAYFNSIPQGILVSEVIEDGPCDNGEIKAGDIVVALDEYEIKSFNDIYTALMNYKEGDKATLKVYRPDIEDYIETEIILQSDEG